MTRAGDGPDWLPDVVPIPASTFEILRQLAFNGEADDLLTFFVQKGQEFVRVRNYVGLLTLADGIQIEILPKVGEEAACRSALLRMLRHLRNSPFRTMTNARTWATTLPLWEVFVAAFLDALETLSRQGIQQTYVATEGNERFWKGKLHISRQQRENAWHAERLAVIYDRLTTDIPANRILKTTLVYLRPRTTARTNQQRIRQLLWTLDEVPESLSVADDRLAVRRLNRLFVRYEPALRWADALLQGRAYGLRAGRFADVSLLFPMSRVFEDYVAHGVRTYWPEPGAVTVQESSAHLVDEHAGVPKFKLRPDLLIRHGNQTIVLDTKWKAIDGHDRVGNYGIEQADLYQLYAYGKKYAADDLFLVYPANETFRQPLAVFGYDAATRLHVVPFDPLNGLAHEVEKLALHALSFQS